MNVVIVGEFSAFAKHLKSGLVRLGHNVVVVFHGDYNKKISGDREDIVYEMPADISLFHVRLFFSRVFLYVIEYFKLKARITKLPSPDLVILINPIFVTKTCFKPAVSIKFIRKWCSEGAKFIMTSCGGDPSWILYRKELRYFSCSFPHGMPKRYFWHLHKFDELLSLSDAIVPMGYDYWFCTNRYVNERNIDVNLVNPIPLPIKYEEIHLSSCSLRKIVIFHGVIRSQVKGTSYFVAALQRLKNDFPDNVDVKIDGNMPYAQYLKVFDKIDILLDQTNSYCSGINAELALMRGKVVLSGNEPENEQMMNLGHCPIINAKPDVDYLYETLKNLVLNPHKIDELKKESREFAVKNLDSIVVANRYLKIVGL